MCSFFKRVTHYVAHNAISSQCSVICHHSATKCLHVRGDWREPSPSRWEKEILRLFKLWTTQVEKYMGHFFAWTIIYFASKNGWPYITKKCINWKRAIQKSISSCYVSMHGQWITDSVSKMKFTWPAIYSLTVLTSGQILSLEWGFQFHELYCSQ